MSTSRLTRLLHGWGIALPGMVMLAALAPLAALPSLSGVGVYPFLACFVIAGLAYLAALTWLSAEAIEWKVLWGFAISFRLVMLLTPVTLSEDVYRYIWDGHLLNLGVNPYAQPVNSPLLDLYATPFRAQVNYPWMATPYLPTAELYFGLVERVVPQNPKAFQAAAAGLDLAAGGLVVLLLRCLNIPGKAVLFYLWNPLVVVEFAHGAHVDALMVFFFTAGLFFFVAGEHRSRTLSTLSFAAAVLVKGWPLLAAPLFARRWGVARIVLFCLAVTLPLGVFATGAGWGLSGVANGRGVFGALRIYSTTWQFNSGLFLWLEKAVGSSAARAISLGAPGLLGLYLGWRSWGGETHGGLDPVVWNRLLVRWSVLPYGLYLILAPTVHPWYLAPVLALLPFFWPAGGEERAVKRWVWPWVYFLFFEAFTYLSYSGLSKPAGFDWIKTAAYLPFWGLLGWAVCSGGLQALDLWPVFRKNHTNQFVTPR